MARHYWTAPVYKVVLKKNHRQLFGDFEIHASSQKDALEQAMIHQDVQHREREWQIIPKSQLAAVMIEKGETL